MLRFHYLSGIVFPLAFLFLFCQNGLSQGGRTFRYSNEIGVDFAPFLRGEPGISLLYKHGLGKTADLEQKKRYALRLQIGYYEYAYGYTTLRTLNMDTLSLTEGSGRTKHRFIRVGTELQVRKKNFRFHIGADLGYRYYTSMGESQLLNRVGNMSFVTEQFEHESKYNVAEASILAGINYFFLPRFSIGLEANVSAGLEFSTSKTLQNGAVLRMDKGTLFEVGPRLLRLLTLSYHLGKPAEK